ncbi:MAG: hypothetical protein RLZZ28_2433 [Bacteroidota bacterium]|jgi:hypothetical protein
MKKLLVSALFVLSTGLFAPAQEKYFTKTGKIGFDATVPKSPENIIGVNKSVTCVLDTKTGNLQLAVLMKGFEFERALMQEHFNENYVESNQFPKAEFRGVLTNNASVNYAKDGSYEVKVKGKLTMHGSTSEIETVGTLAVRAGHIQLNAIFQVLLADFKINVPQLVADKVATQAKISVDCLLDPLKG